MRLYYVLAIAVLTGCVYATVNLITLNEGDSYTLLVITFPNSLAICRLRSPSGEEFAFTPGDQTLSTDKYEVETAQTISLCIVTLKNVDRNDIGIWEISFVTPVGAEGFQLYAITVIYAIEEIILNEITITEGTDLYLHLNNPIGVNDTCKLYGPDGKEYTNAVDDPLYVLNCGYVVRSIGQMHHGKWSIEYGHAIITRARIDVNVLDFKAISTDNIQWILGESIDVSIGPADALHCKIEDPNGHVLFEDFGQCKIVVHIVSLSHKGTWKMSIVVPGTVLLREHNFHVDVQVGEERAVVNTTVTMNDPAVLLTCSLPKQHQVRGCKFRNPTGSTLVALHGVGENGYMFNISSATDCTLRITNLLETDRGIWRCALVTTSEAYYGFLTVPTPRTLKESTSAAVVTEGLLQADRRVFSYLEGEPAVMSCSIPAKLRYCYFRYRNETVYNVFPSMSPSGPFVYTGAGLDAGECGIRFKELKWRDSGDWACHVGLVDSLAQELQASFSLEVTAKISVRQYYHPVVQSMLVVEAIVYAPIDYCRFVQNDGLGFISGNIPEAYELDQTLHLGYCTLYIRNPSWIDYFRWIVAVKLIGQEGELSGMTSCLETKC